MQPGMVAMRRKVKYCRLTGDKVTVYDIIWEMPVHYNFKEHRQE